MALLILVVFALAAGVPEAGAAAQSETADEHAQAVADEYLAIGLTPGGAPGEIPATQLIGGSWIDDHADPYSNYWSARSSDTSVVAVRLGRDDEIVPIPNRPRLNVWIWPVGTGTATITVDYEPGDSCQDPLCSGVSASVSFTVTVADPTPVDGGDDPPDRSDPVARPDPQGIADRHRITALSVDDDSPAQIWVDRLINANSWMLAWSAHWSAESSDTSVVTVALGRHVDPEPAQELLLWIRPVGNGEASVTLGYSRHGKSATTKFTVRVGAAGEDDGEDDGVGPVTNVQEVVNDEVEQEGGLEPGGGAVPIDVNKLFSNVGSGARGRDFDARSSDRRVVTVEVTDNPHVVIRPVGDGTATVTVRYTGGGRSVSAVFGVAVGEGFVPPVPALPLAAAGLLAALLFGAGLRRRRGSL